MSGVGVGIDVGATAVRVVAVAGANADTAAQVTRCAIVPLEPGAVTAGCVHDVNAVGWAISRAVRNAGVRGYGAVLGLSSSDTAMTRVGLSASLKPTEWAGVMRLMRKEISPKVPLEKAFLSLCPVPSPEPSGQQILLAAAAADEHVAYLVAAARKSKVTPKAVDLSAAATLRAFTRIPAGNDDVATLVDIGASKVTVATRQGAHLRSVRTFEGGGERITRAIMGAANVPYDVAEEMKLSMRLTPLPAAAPASLADIPAYGSMTAPPPTIAPQGDHVAAGALNTAVMQLIEDIAAAIDADMVANPARPTQGVLLCGGTSLLRGLKEELVRRVGVPAVVGKPWAVLMPSRQIEAALGPDAHDEIVLMSLATAVGLAMWRKP